jgi:hypothetical protein
MEFATTHIFEYLLHCKHIQGQHLLCKTKMQLDKNWKKRRKYMLGGFFSFLLYSQYVQEIFT